VVRRREHTGKARKLVRAGDLGDEMTARLAVDAPEARRSGEGSFRRSKTWTLNVMGACARVTGSSGQSDARRSSEPEEGSGRR
jgi:hypothetical protein